MNKADIIRLSILNIKSRKKKNILYIIVYVLFITLIISFFSAKNSFLKFVDNYMNSDFHYKIIAVETNNNVESIIEKIEGLNEKHISTIFKNNDYMSHTVDLEGGGYIELFGNYKGINYTLKNGSNIKNEMEMICPDLFYPGLYTDNHDASLYNEMNNNINKNYTIKFDKKIVDKEGKTRILNTFKYDLKLAGTFDSKNDLVGYNVCYVSTSFFEKIKKESAPVYEDINMEKDKYNGLDVMVLVDEYKNLDSVITKINSLGLNAGKYYTMDISFYENIITIIDIIAIIILILSVFCIYVFMKSTILESIKDIALFQLVGYNMYYIKFIFIIQHIVIIILAFILGIIISNFLILGANYLLSLDPNYSVLIIKTRYFEVLLYLILLFGILYIVEFSLFKKYSMKFSPIQLMSGDL